MERSDDLLNGVRSATIAEISVLTREVRVRVGVLSRPVTIRIYHHPDGPEAFTFEISHVMNTATASRARDIPRSADSENEALRQAVRTLTQDYEDAVRGGEMPDEGWLVESAARR